MKTLIVYDKSTGNVSFTQSISDIEDVEYTTIIADVPGDRVVARVENGEVILEDTPEIKEKKQKIIKLNEEVYKIKLELLEDLEDMEDF